MSSNFVVLLVVGGIIAYLLVALQKSQKRVASEKEMRQLIARQMIERGRKGGSADHPDRPDRRASIPPRGASRTAARDAPGTAPGSAGGTAGGGTRVAAAGVAVGGAEVGMGTAPGEASSSCVPEFPVLAPDALSGFDSVGGMENFKQEIRDSVGLILADAAQADAYGIKWNGLLLHGAPGVGKTFLARAIAGEFGLNLLHVSTGDLVEGVIGQSAQNVQRVFAAAADHRPCLLLFDEFDSIAQRRDSAAQPEERRIVNQLLISLEGVRGGREVIVVATTNDLEHLDPAVIRPGRFDRHVRIDMPDEAARRSILAVQLADRPACGAVDLDDLARRTEGLTPAVLTQIVDAAALGAFREAAGQGNAVRITMEHLLAALAARGGRDRPTVEDWDWDHLVLPEAIKAELQQLQAMLEDPDLARSYGVETPSGVLLGGPPGTGKTTVARVLAAQARCSFYPVSAADVTSKWAGESERNIRQLFERARQNRPSIIFIDEVDAIASRRGVEGELAGRQLNQLLVEMDGLKGSAGVLVIAATNRPERLDPALLRGGRLSRTISLELPDVAARHAIIRQATKRMPTVGVDLAKVAAATDGFSGADLKAACQQSALHALVRATAEGAPEAAPAVLPDDFVRAVAHRRAELATQASTHAPTG